MTMKTRIALSKDTSKMTAHPCLCLQDLWEGRQGKVRNNRIPSCIFKVFFYAAMLSLSPFQANAAPSASVQKAPTHMHTWTPCFVPVGSHVELLLPPSYVMRSSTWAERYPLDAASPATFEMIVPGDIWGRDKENVYYGARRIPGVDGSKEMEIFVDSEGSFHIFNGGKRFVLYRPWFSHAAGETDSESKSMYMFNFIVREYGAGLAADTAHDDALPKTPLPDPEKMTRIFPAADPPMRFWNPASWESPYLTDGKRLYYLPDNFRFFVAKAAEEPERPVPIDADPASAVMLDHEFLQDQNTVYYRGEKTDFDAATFRLLDNNYSQDANGVYYNQVKLVTAKGHAPLPEEFDTSEDWRPGNPTGYTRTRDAVFLREYPIATDAATFTLIGDGYARDAKRIFHNGVPIGNADPDSFKLLSGIYYGWATDGHTIYENGKPVFRGADPATFKLTTGFLAGDASRVWLLEERKPLRGIDAAGLRMLSLSGYATDGKRVFYREEEIPGADAASFQTLSAAEFSRDNSALYYRSHKLTGVDPLSFVVFPERETYPVYFGDKDHVYVLKDEMPELLPGADPKTFRVVSQEWVMDGKQVWYDGHLVEGMRSDGFTPLDGEYVKNADHVYLGRNKLDGAHPASFRILGLQFCLDGSTLYYRTSPCQKPVDPASVTELNWYYAKDAHTVFYETGVVNGADVASFRSWPGGMRYALDASHVYFQGGLVKGADPASFQPCGGGAAGDARHFYKEDKAFDTLQELRNALFGSGEN